MICDLCNNFLFTVKLGKIFVNFILGHLVSYLYVLSEFHKKARALAKVINCVNNFSEN